MVVHCIFVHHPSLDSILETLSSPVLSRRQEGEEENVSVGSSVEGSKGSLGGHLWGATFDGEDEEYLRESRCFQDSSDEFSGKSFRNYGVFEKIHFVDFLCIYLIKNWIIAL